MGFESREKFAAAFEAAKFRPGLGLAIVALSFGTALLEGVGLGFLLPIIELARSSPSSTDVDGVLQVFVRVYSFAGIPFTLEYLIVGVGSVMSVRFGLSFLTAWLQAKLSTGYQRHLRERLFESLVYAPIEYIDGSGSDDLLNSLITETRRSAGIVMAVFNVTEIALRGVVYLVVAALMSLELTLLALVGLGTSTLAVRYVLEPAYAVGDDVAEVNSEVQTISQTGIQGMRDVRLFTMRSELVERMQRLMSTYMNVNVRLRRNQAALNNLNQFTNAAVVFALVYVGFSFTGLSIGQLGVFLFAVFRLSPVVNNINNALYTLDGQMPHLLRVRERINDLADQEATGDEGSRSIDSVDTVEFSDVSFAYDDDQVLQDVSFSVDRGEKIALVGPSGAGKSTIVSLLSRLRTPTDGRILADGVSIAEFDLEQWRQRLAVVRQDPFLFDDTLWENVTVGVDAASRGEVERACSIAQVTEFLPELPNGYDTELGEGGIRLSGGQRQRVAIARAILKDADVLVLDEATSELDSNIERDVYEGIRRLEGNYATISIAHRLSTVNDADRIYTLDNGSVVEVGTHKQLVEQEGTYAGLYATQS